MSLSTFGYFYFTDGSGTIKEGQIIGAAGVEESRLKNGREVNWHY